MCNSDEANLYQRQLILINLINPVYWFASYVTSADLQQRLGTKRTEVHANLDGSIIIARLIGVKRWQGFQERDINYGNLMNWSEDYPHFNNSFDEMAPAKRESRSVM